MTDARVQMLLTEKECAEIYRGLGSLYITRMLVWMHVPGGPTGEFPDLNAGLAERFHKAVSAMEAERKVREKEEGGREQAN